MTPIHEKDVDHLRHAIELATRARDRGNAPFGAILVGEDGRVLAEGQNTVDTERDVTGHAEINLIREAWRLHDVDTLATSTLYASGEPCAMCAGTIFWSGVGRVVYGASARRIHEILSDTEESPRLRLSCREVLAAGSRPTEVLGLLLEEEAERVFEGSAG
jgi:tRNA(Arg) A34 adenosine deaminase TadA